MIGDQNTRDYRAALNALKSGKWMLVPIDATLEMKGDAWRAMINPVSAADLDRAWAAMLAAAPSVPAVSVNNKPSAESGKRLKEYLFGNINSTIGIVGMGNNCYFVYMHCFEKSWLGNKPMQWEGITIEWRWNVGRPIASPAVDDSFWQILTK